MSQGEPMKVLLRVRYGECDAQGIVFNARYGDFADVAMCEFMRAVAGVPGSMEAAGFDSRVARLAIDFHSPARYDQVLAIGVRALAVGNTSFRLAMQVNEHPSGRPVAAIESVHVLVDAKNFVKTPVPGDLRARLLQGAPGVVIDQAGVAARG